MAKPRRKPKDKSASGREDKRVSVPTGTAGRTLRKARFFLRQADSERHRADHSERRRDVEPFECYVEAASIFARSVLGHLRNEFRPLKRKPGRYDEFKNWLELREQNPLIKDLIDTRDAFVHGGSKGIVSVQSDETDILFGPLKEDHEKLPGQLDEIQAIIEESKRRFS